MKVTLVGGGGFRTPLVYGALLEVAPRLGIEQLALHDLDGGRLERMAGVLRALGDERGAQIPLLLTSDLGEAVDAATFVLCAIRVGGLEGRLVDEQVPLERGVLGQETTGPGGLAYALRTVPAMMELAETMARRAPDAWLVNFTNPAGLVTEAVQRVLGPRAIGICDTPPSTFRAVAAALGRPAGELWFDYFGLNHLGWLRRVVDRGSDLLPGLLADESRLAPLEEAQLFGAGWLQALGLLPNEYLYYYYRTAEAVAGMRRRSRARFLAENQARFYRAAAGDGAAALAAWRETVAARNASYMAEARAEEPPEPAAAEGDGGSELPAGGYEGVAAALMEALAGEDERTLVLNTANRGSLPFLDADAVVEVPCLVSRAGVFPVAVGDVPPHARGLIEIVKDVERTTIAAADSGSSELAVRALALHPLVPSTEVASEIWAAYRGQQPLLAARFS